ncbi:MAG: cytochrome c biogenesis protein CcdA [Alphaproteobacteria bacterium]|nr:cytochrome c biogenesis protein CcdA [Alphaproteobacteria bacterium]
MLGERSPRISTKSETRPLPVVAGSAVSAHRWGPLALAAGLTLSFTAIGLFVATIGFSIGLGGNMFQPIGAGLLVAFGIVLLLPQLQIRFATAIGPLVGGLEQRASGIPVTGLSGQFGLGLLFGAVWRPCTGPMLGAAALMASTGQNLAQASLIMLAFGLGASLPLLVLGAVSRTTFLRWRSHLDSFGRAGKMLLGSLLILLGLFVATGLNQVLETALVFHAPAWLLQLTSRY